MIPVVMEPSLLDSMSWNGVFGEELRGRKNFIDMTTDDVDVFEAKCDELTSRIQYVVSVTSSSASFPSSTMTSSGPASLSTTSTTGFFDSVSPLTSRSPESTINDVFSEPKPTHQEVLPAWFASKPSEISTNFESSSSSSSSSLNLAERPLPSIPSSSHLEDVAEQNEQREMRIIRRKDRLEAYLGSVMSTNIVKAANHIISTLNQQKRLV
jgi:hypothetical protein